MLEQLLLIIGSLLLLLPDFILRLGQYLLDVELVNDLFNVLRKR